MYTKFRKNRMKIWEQTPVDADIVIGVQIPVYPLPLVFPKPQAYLSGGFLIKNRYIGRSFIIPSQEMREHFVNLKLNPIVSEMKDKKSSHYR